jgi:D-alanyl-D-alanine carboxypeptidase/D-alanyl-D-alanine-endopeptidase (penicillin-binding protein 4)
MRLLILLLASLLAAPCVGQAVSQRLQAAMNKLQLDSQFKHAIVAITVADAQTGKIVFEKHSQLALAPASTQKVITSMAAFELLGANYRYETVVSYDGMISDSVLTGNLFVLGSGDPTLGSKRWKQTVDVVILNNIVAAVKKAGIKKITGTILCGNSAFSAQSIPGGWLWEDIGSYYGAGAHPLNWRENSYDIELSSGKELGTAVKVTGSAGGKYFPSFTNELVADKKNTGDNAYIYHSLDAYTNPVLRGTIPVEEKSFKISGAYPNPAKIFLEYLHEYLGNAGIKIGDVNVPQTVSMPDNTSEKIKNPTILLKIQSPPLDSINYYFLRNSVNLYGEALVKTISLQKAGFAETDKGVEWVRDFWQQKGIPKTALEIQDGSGLSPQNRVTTSALAKALLYAKNQPWFAAFYNGLPEYNGMKLKSGSIGGVRAYAGYHKTSNGKEYAISIIANGYNGSGSAVTKKMFVVLDVLK